MQVAVCRAFGKPLTIEEATLAGPGPGEIEVEIAACAICHSDIIYADGGWGGQLPAVYGHEAAGKVVGIGAGVMGFEKGDHVVVTLIRACGGCPACADGNPVSCSTKFPLSQKSPLRTRDGEPLVQALIKVRYTGWTEIFMHPFPRGIPILPTAGLRGEW